VSQNVDPLTLERYEDWLAHPITVALNQHLRRQLEELSSQWRQGNFTSDTVDKTALLNANAIGQCEVLDTLLNLKPEEFLEQPE
jgi:hypothetical protein